MLCPAPLSEKAISEDHLSGEVQHESKGQLRYRLGSWPGYPDELEAAVASVFEIDVIQPATGPNQELEGTASLEDVRRDADTRPKDEDLPVTDERP